MAEPSVICELCASIGGEPIWENALCRVVSNADRDYPGYCRVILNRHAREMTDLSEDERREIMRIVFAVESALRRLINPDKTNLASLGNMVAHIHWHVIPRWREDRCFPNPIWGATQRTATAVPAAIDSLLLKAEMTAQLGDSTPASRKCPS